MNRVVFQTLIVAICAMTVSGCVQTRSSRAILLAPQDHFERQVSPGPIINSRKDQDTVSWHTARDINGFPFGSNPIFIANDSKFTVNFNRLNPGWIFADKVRARKKRPNQSENTRKAMLRNSEWALPNDSDRQALDPSFNQARIDHLRGRELWVLTEIRSLDTSDILETKSKIYRKTANVKLDSEAFSLVPLDVSESLIFSHASDSSYRLEVKVYEVDRVKLKRELLGVVRSPGVQGLLNTLASSATKMVGAIGGEILESKLKAGDDDPQALERLLLQHGAALEFHGSLLILRDGSFHDRYSVNQAENNIDQEVVRSREEKFANASEPAKRLLVSNDYLLADFGKHGRFTNAINNPVEYQAAHDRLHQMCFATMAAASKNCTPIQTEPYLWVTVTESQQISHQIGDSNRELDVKTLEKLVSSTGERIRQLTELTESLVSNAEQNTYLTGEIASAEAALKEAEARYADAINRDANSQQNVLRAEEILYEKLAWEREIQYLRSIEDRTSQASVAANKAVLVETRKELANEVSQLKVRQQDYKALVEHIRLPVD